MRDPLYRAILAALAEPLDDQVFEPCACDLLRGAYPDLAPVEGGSDDGMDGTIGSRGFLVCTTGSRVIENLTASLKRHLSVGGTRRQVVVATSEALSQTRKRNLEKRAKDLGFRLLQVFDRHALAPLLYYAPHWRKALLGLTGMPSALTVVPRSRLPLFDIELVGRDQDLRWLKETQGDRVLVGGPASGKTAALAHLARQGWGLFVVSTDLAAISDAVLEQQPTVLVVDDAHVEPDFLDSLRHLRETIGATFQIVATTWKGGCDSVRAALGGAQDSQVHELALLDRDQLVDVVRRAGVAGPIELVRVIVNQSSNQPGLAVTLTQAALAGSVSELVTGRAIARYVTTWLQRSVEPRLPEVLAAFSLGGAAGMGIDAVSSFTGIPYVDVYRLVAQAAAAGTVSEVGRDRLAVVPRALRSRLVADHFFPPTGPRLPYREFFANAPSHAEAIRGLLHAAHVGGDVPRDELRALVGSTSDVAAWALYAALGEGEARWVIEHYDGDDSDVSAVLLRRVPRDILPILLIRETSDERERSYVAASPLNLVRRWVQDLDASTDEMIGRRLALLHAAENAPAELRSSGLAAQAACMALSPSIEGTSTDPGMGQTLTSRRGIIPGSVRAAITAEWERVCALIDESPEASWSAATELVRQWTYPESRVPSDVDEMQAFARRMVSDLGSIAADRSGLLRALNRDAQALMVDLPECPDSNFDILYPAEDYSDDWRTREKLQRENALKLANEWKSPSAYQLADWLSTLEREAAAGDLGGPRLTPLLCKEIANSNAKPDSYVEAIVGAGLKSDLLEPFLTKLRDFAPERWASLIPSLFDQVQYQALAFHQIITSESPPQQLVELALSAAPAFTQLIGAVCLRSEAPAKLLPLLLGHEDVLVAFAAARGIWNAPERGDIPTPIASVWKQAVLRTAEVERGEFELGSSARHGLGEILRNDPELAFDWLDMHLRDRPESLFFDEKSPAGRALEALSRTRRRELLDHRNLGKVQAEVVGALVGDELSLYEELLDRPELAMHHLAPLEGKPDDSWCQKAKLALSRGKSVEDVVASALGTRFGWSGYESDHWRTWEDAFQRLEQLDDEELKAVGRAGREYYAQLRRQAEHRERDRRLQGFHTDV